MCSRPAVSKSACLTGWHQRSCSTERERKDKSQDLLTEWAAHLASSRPTCRAGNTNSTSRNQCSIDLKLFPEYLNPLQESCDYTVCLRSFEAFLRPRGVTSGHWLNSSVSSSRMKMCFNNQFYFLFTPASSPELQSEWMELLERLCRTLHAIISSACPRGRAAAQSQRSALSPSGTTKRLQGLQGPLGQALWAPIR